jgi:fido (protein-threonine AMPylation protein)
LQEVFRQLIEDNGKSTRIRLDLILKKNLSKGIDWSQAVYFDKPLFSCY